MKRVKPGTKNHQIAIELAAIRVECRVGRCKQQDPSLQDFVSVVRRRRQGVVGNESRYKDIHIKTYVRTRRTDGPLASFASVTVEMANNHAECSFCSRSSISVYYRGWMWVCLGSKDLS